MPTFGKVTACASPAVWLVEGYSGEGQEQSLDRTVFACEKHLATAEAGWLRGLEPHTQRATGLNWCGQFTDYNPETGVDL
ncbi:hypothetical protein [Streptomyces sp. NPDC051546]|uniref:hypothetical protein n=1 Tax=Streptomyces sp. NPDC051546 TaxID=3365655 RepID=UPI0037A6456C